MVGPDRSSREVTMQPSRRVLMLAALVLALPLAGAPQAGASGKKEKPEPEAFGRLTAGQVERRLGQAKVYVFDGNSPETYAEHHLPGAVRMNHKEITRGVLPADKDATLVFYCMNEL